jgi:ABC-2 type transport system ATP-binding protein
LKKNVGNERLELVLKSDEEVLKTLDALSSEVVRKEELRTITVAVDGSIGHVKRLLDALEHSQVQVESFSLHKPTLDDVFLQLTGRQATIETEIKK